MDDVGDRLMPLNPQPDEPEWLSELRGYPPGQPGADGLPGEPGWIMHAELIAKLVRMKRLQLILLAVNVLVFVMQLVNVWSSWTIMRILRPGWLPWQ